MSTVETPVIRCEGCGKTAAWKPEYAGRKVRCKCGHVIQVGPPAAAAAAVAPGRPSATPATSARAAAAATAARPAAAVRPTPATRPAPAAATPRPPAARPPPEPADPFADGASFDDIVRAAAAEAAAPPLPSGSAPANAGGPAGGGGDDDFGGYGLAPEPAIPIKPLRQAHTTVAAGPTLAVAGAGGGPASPIVGYAGFQRRRTTADEQEQLAEYQRQNLIVPAVLIAVGLLATFVEARLWAGETNLLMMTAYVAFTTIINLVLIFVALLITSKLLDLGLGEIGPALLKITAVAILPAALGGVVREATGGFGALLAYAVSLGCYYILLYWLFDMDAQEMMICTAIIWVIRTWVGFFMVMAILNALGGDPDAAAGGGPGGGTGGPGPGGGGTPAPWVAPGAADPDDDTDPDDPDMAEEGKAKPAAKPDAAKPDAAKPAEGKNAPTADDTDPDAAPAEPQ